MPLLFRLILVFITCLLNFFIITDIHTADAASIGKNVQYSNAKHTKAKPVTKVIAKPIVKESVNESLKYGNAGRQALIEKKYDQATLLLKKAIAISDSLPTQGLNHKITGLFCSLLGEALFQQKKYEEAYTSFKRALNIYARPENKNEEQVFYLLGGLGIVDMYTGRYLEAKPLYEKLLPLEIQRYGPDSKQAQLVRMQLADISKIQDGPDYTQALGPTIKRWANNTTPVYVYIENGSDIPGWRDTDSDLAMQAYQEWQKALNDQLKFEFTNDPLQADTILGWEKVPAHHDNSRVNEYGYCITTADKNNFLTTNDVFIALNSEILKPFSEAEIYNLLLHEIGHSLGLAHSPKPTDAMFYSTAYDHGHKKSLSLRDIATVNALYHMTPTITNQPDIRVTRYKKSLELADLAGKSLNNRDWRSAYDQFQQSLSFYDNPNNHYFCGLAAWELHLYEPAFSHLKIASLKSLKHQSYASKMAGFSAMQLAEAYRKQGALTLAEQYYVQAYQLFNLALEKGLDLESTNAVQVQLDWLNKKLSTK